MIEVVWIPFNKASLAASLCAGTALKPAVAPAGPVTLQLSVVVLLAWQCSKKNMGVTL